MNERNRRLKHLLTSGLGLILIICLGAFLSQSDTLRIESQITDVHFHPCSFSHDCVPLDRMMSEMDKSGVETAWVFGLQHQLQRDPGAMEHWPETNTCELNTPMTLPAEPDFDTCKAIQTELVKNGQRPFHYNDICSNPGWPVAPNSQADETIFEQYQALSPDQQNRLRPFLSFLNLDDPCAQTDTGENSNLAYVKAMDRKYPRTIFGFAEHNLNKQILFSHDACRPNLNQVRVCSGELMNYMAETRRPFGIHLDLQDTEGNTFEDLLLSLAEWYPDVIMIWHHAGIAPEVTDRLPAQTHIGVMEQFIATSPGKRYIGLSWPNGFFRRLNAEEMDTDQFGWPIERNTEHDQAAYVQFFENNKDALLFGSDQVSLFYEETTVLGRKLHNAYSDDYKKTIDAEVSALRAITGSEGVWGDDGAAWKAITRDNANRIIEQIDWSKVATQDDE